jgi:hypothetical protein
LISSGYAALDGILPERGLRRGTLVEWLEDGPGSGAGTLALAAGREASRDGGALVVVDRPEAACRFYPPAAAALGIDLERTLLVRPARAADEAWALDQALGSRGVGAVACWCGSKRRGTRDWRRWQLAAERGGCLGLFIRPSHTRAEPCWSELRLLVGRCDRRIQVTLLRSRLGVAGATVEWSLTDEPSGDEPSDNKSSDSESSAVRVASRLAVAAPPGRPTRTA